MEQKNTNGHSQKPSADNFGYDDSTRAARDLFKEPLPMSLGGWNIKSVTPAAEHLERLHELRARYAERAQEIVEDEVEYLGGHEQNPEALASEIDDFGVGALEATREFKGTAESKETKRQARAITVEVIAEPGDQPGSARRISNIPEDKIEDLLRAKVEIGDTTSIPEITRELDRERKLIKIAKDAAALNDNYLKLVSDFGNWVGNLPEEAEIKGQIQELKDTILSFETPEDQITATFEAVTHMKHGGNADNQAEYGALDQGVIIDPVLRETPHQAEIVKNYAKLAPNPGNSDYAREKVFNDVLKNKEYLDREALLELSRQLYNQGELYSLPDGVLVQHEGENSPAEDMILQAIVDRRDVAALPVISMLSADQQLEYLDKLHYNEATPGGAFSRSYLPTIDTQGIKAPLHKLEEIADSHGVYGSFMMLYLAHDGLSEVDHTRYLQKSIADNQEVSEQWQRTGNAYSIRSHIEKLVRSNIDQPSFGVSPASNLNNFDIALEKSHDALSAVYESARQYGAEDVIVGAVNHATGINIFKKVVQGKGDDPLDLYRDYFESSIDEYSPPISDPFSPFEQIEGFYEKEDITPELVSEYVNILATKGDNISLSYFLQDCDAKYDTFETILAPGDIPAFTKPRSATTKVIESLPPAELTEVISKAGRTGDLIEALQTLNLNLLRHLKDNPRLTEMSLATLNSDTLDISDVDFQKLSKYLHSEATTSQVDNLNEATKSQLSDFYRLFQQTETAMSACGPTVEGFMAIKALENLDEAPGDLARLGVTHTGAKGVEQFKAITRELVETYQNVDYSEQTLQDLEDSPLHRAIFEKTYRINEGEYLVQAASVSEIARYLDENKHNISKLNPAFETRRYDIKNSGEQQDGIQISQATIDNFLARSKDVVNYRNEGDSVRIITELSNDLSTLLEQSSQLLESIESGSNEKYATLGNEQKQEYFRINEERKHRNLTDAISYLEEGGNDTSELFSMIGNISETHGHMRSLAIYESIAGMDYLDRVKLQRNVRSGSDISTTNLLALKEILNATASAVDISDKKLRKNYKSLFNTRFIDDEISRLHQLDQAGGKVTDFSFIPTRGLGMELSGQLSDACWANQYKSIAEEFPNLTTVIFKRHSQNPDHERLTGSMLLIEGETEDGSPALIARGINPLENQTSKIDSEHFIESVTDYVRETARKLDAIPTIVLDEGSGGAATNRPLIFDSLEKLASNLDKIAIKDTKEVEFNGYNLKDIVYRIS